MHPRPTNSADHCYVPSERRRQIVLDCVRHSQSAFEDPWLEFVSKLFLNWLLTIYILNLVECASLLALHVQLLWKDVTTQHAQLFSKQLALWIKPRFPICILRCFVGEGQTLPGGYQLNQDVSIINRIGNQYFVYALIIVMIRLVMLWTEMAC